ncbi:MAG: AbrB/MazE/SpoVT family DNA-binding domain-containing protein [Nitrososphaeraceae archaeon]
MPIKYTVTVTSVGNSSVIVMPKPVIDGFNLKKGQRLQMIVKDNGIYIPLPAPKEDSVRKEVVRE